MSKPINLFDYAGELHEKLRRDILEPDHLVYKIVPGTFVENSVKGHDVTWFSGVGYLDLDKLVMESIAFLTDKIIMDKLEEYED